MTKGSGTLLSPEEISGNWQGNGCMCTPACCNLQICACGCGICVVKKVGPCPIMCTYMIPCCGKCYCDCDNEGLWASNEDPNTLEQGCGLGWVRVGGATGAPAGSPTAVEMTR